MTKQQKSTLKKLLRQVALARDKWCLKCGKTDDLQCSHIYPVGTYRKMAYMADNVKILCRRHHLYWFHKHPIEAHEWLKTAIPKERLDKLALRARTIDKKPINFMEEKLYLEQELKRYESQNMDSI